MDFDIKPFQIATILASVIRAGVSIILFVASLDAQTIWIKYTLLTFCATYTAIGGYRLVKASLLIKYFKNQVD